MFFKKGFARGNSVVMLFCKLASVGQSLPERESLPERDITKYALKDFHAFRPSPDTVVTIYKATISGVFNEKRPRFQGSRCFGVGAAWR